jgi:hypothetical protein
VCLDEVREQVGARLLDEQGGCTDAQREYHQAAESEGESQRRRACEDVVRIRLEHVLGERVRVGEHVTVKVHGRLRSTGGSGGEGQQSHVVSCGDNWLEIRRLRLAEGRKVVAGIAAVRDDPHARYLGRGQVFEEPVVTKSQVTCTDFGDSGQFAGSEQRHGAYHDGTSTQYAEPARDQPWVVRPAEQDPAARYDPQLVHKHFCDLV